MTKNKITDITLEDIRALGHSQGLEDGLILTNRLMGQGSSQIPQRMNFILMALCLRGEVRYSIDTHEHVVKQGDLLFVSDRHIVDYYQATDDFECQCIMVSTEFYHSFVLNVRNVSSLLLFSMSNPVVPLTAHEIDTYGNYYRTILEKIADSEHHYRTQLVKALLLAMFYDMSGVIWRVEQQEFKSQTRGDFIFSRFIRELEENFRTERRVSWYAQQLGITPKYLAEMVKQVSKRTPNDWIDHYVILELRVMLRNSTKSIREITEALNFPNQSFLGKYFKEHVGMSPSEYRRK